MAGLRYMEQWRRTITRLGRWVDFDHDYKTMEPKYMESVMWVFSELYKKGLVYEDFRSSLYCTRCETPLSKMETTMDDSYQDVQDPSIYVAFAAADHPNTYLLAWTTTPWTLSGNVALTVKPDTEYVEVELTQGAAPWLGRHLIVAASRVEQVLAIGTYTKVKTVRGSELIGWRYEPVQEFVKPDGEAYRVVAADFVTLDDGTGIVHIAPAFGDDDFALSKREQLPVLLTINNAGQFLSEVTPWAGQHVKAAESSIIERLQAEGKLYKAETITHSYPFCWRCANPLIYKVQKSWYVKVETLKKEMLATNEKIHWVPEHLKEGRFKLGMESAPDWGVSRSRYWGVPIPVWRCDRCQKERVIGSLDELESVSGKRPHDLHRPLIDEVAWACACGGTFQRVPEVLDVWFDSGAMPYGQVHYPFGNKELFEATFPADFITEYIPQTRGWFYYMHVFANALFGKPAFKHVLATGTILAGDGTKMSKSKGNFPNVDLILDRYGSDALRFYLLSSAVMQGEAVNYSEEAMAESVRKLLLPLTNVFAFFALYAPKGKHMQLMKKPVHVLDRWILARLEETRRTVEDGLDSYELWRAVRPLVSFVTDLSTWYVRRSRDRFKGEDAHDRVQALSTLYSVLLTSAKLLAPFVPFIAEHLYQQLKPWNAKALDSVHLEPWPKARKEFLDEFLLKNMLVVRDVVENGHAMRAKLKLKVRQPLGEMWVSGGPSSLSEIWSRGTMTDLSSALSSIISNELNVKKVSFGEPPKWKNVAVGTIDTPGASQVYKVAFDTKLSPELKCEGLRRELVRQVNALRKAQGLTIHDYVRLVYTTESQLLKEVVAKDGELLKKDILAQSISEGTGTHELRVDGERMLVSLER